MNLKWWSENPTIILLLFCVLYGKILSFGETSENLVRARRRVVRLKIYVLSYAANRRKGHWGNITLEKTDVYSTKSKYPNKIATLYITASAGLRVRKNIRRM